MLLEEKNDVEGSEAATPHLTAPQERQSYPIESHLLEIATRDYNAVYRELSEVLNPSNVAKYVFGNTEPFVEVFSNLINGSACFASQSKQFTDLMQYVFGSMLRKNSCVTIDNKADIDSGLFKLLLGTRGRVKDVVEVLDNARPGRLQGLLQEMNAEQVDFALHLLYSRLIAGGGSFNSWLSWSVMYPALKNMKLIELKTIQGLEEKILQKGSGSCSIERDIVGFFKKINNPQDALGFFLDAVAGKKPIEKLCVGEVIARKLAASIMTNSGQILSPLWEIKVLAQNQGKLIDEIKRGVLVSEWVIEHKQLSITEALAGLDRRHLYETRGNVLSLLAEGMSCRQYCSGGERRRSIDRHRKALESLLESVPRDLKAKIEEALLKDAEISQHQQKFVQTRERDAGKLILELCKDSAVMLGELGVFIGKQITINEGWFGNNSVDQESAAAFAEKADLITVELIQALAETMAMRPITYQACSSPNHDQIILFSSVDSDNLGVKQPAKNPTNPSMGSVVDDNGDIFFDAYEYFYESDEDELFDDALDIEYSPEKNSEKCSKESELLVPDVIPASMQFSKEYKHEIIKELQKYVYRDKFQDLAENSGKESELLVPDVIPASMQFSKEYKHEIIKELQKYVYRDKFQDLAENSGKESELLVPDIPASMQFSKEYKHEIIKELHEYVYRDKFKDLAEQIKASDDLAVALLELFRCLIFTVRCWLGVGDVQEFAQVLIKKIEDEDLDGFVTVAVDMLTRLKPRLGEQEDMFRAMLIKQLRDLPPNTLHEAVATKAFETLPSCHLQKMEAESLRHIITVAVAA